MAQFIAIRLADNNPVDYVGTFESPQDAQLYVARQIKGKARPTAERPDQVWSGVPELEESHPDSGIWWCSQYYRIALLKPSRRESDAD